MNTKFENQLEQLMTYFASVYHPEELLEGKKYFFSKLGLGAEDPDGFESRMDLFYDWFLFTRPLNESGLTPAQFVLNHSKYEIKADERVIYEGLARTEHSLYEVLRIRDQDVLVHDILADQKKLVNDRSFSFGLEKGQIFDGRLVPFQSEYWFCKGFCFHPVEVKDFIEKEIKGVFPLDAQAQEELMIKLMQMKFKVDKYRHLQLDDVYSNEAKVKF